MTEKTMKKNLSEYARVCEQIEELQTRKKALAERIKSGMGDQEEVKCGEFIAKNKKVTACRFDTAAFKTEHGSLYKDFCKSQTTKRFTVVMA